MLELGALFIKFCHFLEICLGKSLFFVQFCTSKYAN